jgi:hypothetical protein
LGLVTRCGVGFGIAALNRQTSGSRPLLRHGFRILPLSTAAVILQCVIKWSLSRNL